MELATSRTQTSPYHIFKRKLKTPFERCFNSINYLCIKQLQRRQSEGDKSPNLEWREHWYRCYRPHSFCLLCAFVHMVLRVCYNCLVIQVWKAYTIKQRQVLNIRIPKLCDGSTQQVNCNTSTFCFSLQLTQYKCLWGWWWLTICVSTATSGFILNSRKYTGFLPLWRVVKTLQSI